MSGFNPFNPDSFFYGGAGSGRPGSNIDTYTKRLRPYQPNQASSLCLKEESTYGNKIYLPDRVLDDLSRLQIEYPILFRVENPKTGEATHAGVLEFTAEMGRTWLPSWMMEKLKIQGRDMVKITNVTLPKCTYVKLEPQSVDFLEISDTRAVLERAMGNYSTLTKGDIIPFKYAGKVHEIKILELKPDDAVSIVETDMETDFAPPVGYVEPKKWEPSRIRQHYEQSARSQSPSVSSNGETTPKRGGVVLNAKRRVRRGNQSGASTPSTTTTATSRKGPQLADKVTETDPAQKQAAPFELPLGHLFFGYDIPTPPPSDEGEGASANKGKDKDTGEGSTDGNRRPRRGVTLGTSAGQRKGRTLGSS